MLQGDVHLPIWDDGRYLSLTTLKRLNTQQEDLNCNRRRQQVKEGGVYPVIAQTKDDERKGGR